VDGVASLLDKSLVQQSEQEGEEPRLVLLETIREYALGALAACGELGATRRAHAAYYLSLAEEAEAEIEGPQQVSWLERLEREHDNLRTALRWGLEPAPEEEGDQRRELALRLGEPCGSFGTSIRISKKDRPSWNEPQPPARELLLGCGPRRSSPLQC
jgi:hypothetical protein